MNIERLEKYLNGQLNEDEKKSLDPIGDIIAARLR